VLIIKFNTGQIVRLFDTKNSVELGKITRLKPSPNNPHGVLLGFDFLDSVQILRDSLLNGKETNGNVKNHTR